MKHGDITKLARVAGCSVSFIAAVLRPGSPNPRHPNAKRAKLLARATGTDPWVWLEGSPEEIRAAINEAEAKALKERETIGREEVEALWEDSL